MDGIIHFHQCKLYFMARGPSFNKNIQINSLKNVDIYHIACRILNLTPNPNANAGSLVNLTNLFPTPENTTPENNSGSFHLSSLLPMFFLLFLNILNIIINKILNNIYLLTIKCVLCSLTRCRCLVEK